METCFFFFFFYFADLLKNPPNLDENLLESWFKMSETSTRTNGVCSRALKPVSPVNTAQLFTCVLTTQQHCGCAFAGVFSHADTLISHKHNQRPHSQSKQLAYSPWAHKRKKSIGEKKRSIENCFQNSYHCSTWRRRCTSWHDNIVYLHHVDGQSVTAVTSGANERPNQSKAIVIQRTWSCCGAALEGRHSPVACS